MILKLLILLERYLVIKLLGILLLGVFFFFRCYRGKLIDYISVASEDSAQYLKPLVSGLMCRLSDKYEAEEYDRITYIHANAKIKRLIDDYTEDCPGTEVNILFRRTRTCQGSKKPSRSMKTRVWLRRILCTPGWKK